jgi:sugar-phosphatase
MRFRVQAILFDIDGTLVDSTAVVIRTWQTWAARHDLDVERILEVCHGRRSVDTISLFLPPDQVAAATAEMEGLELADVRDVIALPGAAALLGQLPADRWAAVTSGSQALMRTRLVTAGLPAPEVLVGAEDVRAGKPDPEGYLKAAAVLGWDIGQCLVVEDAPAGITAGRTAGARTLAVATSHEPAQLVAADAVVSDLTSCTVEVAGDGLVLSTEAAGSRRPTQSWRQNGSE